MRMLSLRKPAQGKLKESGAKKGSRSIFKRMQLNKNIYTKILFTNLAVFAFSLAALITYSGFTMEQIIYDQLQQDLVHKAEQINLTLNHLTDNLSEDISRLLSEKAHRDLKSPRQDWEKAQGLFRVGVISKTEYDRSKTAYQNAVDSYQKALAQSKKELLNFLAALLNAEKITIFNAAGNIIAASGEQEVSFDSKVEGKYIDALHKGQIEVVKTMAGQTNGPVFKAVIPVKTGEKKATENGILLAVKPPNLDLVLNRMHLQLIIGGIIILMVVIFSSVYLAMGISRPISRLTTTVAEISRGGDIRCPENHPLDELHILTDQLKQLASRMRTIQTESNRVDEERARLFSEISHELRTPLTSVQGFVEAIQDGMAQDPALLEKYLDTIYAQTLHITRLVDDMLELGRLESGNMIVAKQPLDLVVLIQGVIISLEAEANKKQSLLLFEKRTENAFAIGDVDRMEQIIRNLLKNAIKATENGSIKICIDVQQGSVDITIKDNGMGIAAEDLPHIWERFYRGKNQRGSHSQEKGSGLGLVIVKKLVQLQDGVIQVESQLGKGTTFRLSFPSFNS